MPGAVGDFSEFGTGEGKEIENDPWQVAIAQDEIGGSDGLFRRLAAEPEEFGAILRRERRGIKLVPAIDESQFRDGRMGGFVCHDGGDHEGKSCGGVGRHDFRDSSAGKWIGIPEVEVRPPGIGSGWRESVACRRKFLPELLLELGEGWVRHGLRMVSYF